MLDQLKLLEELQRFDARVQEYESSLKALPEKLRSLQENLARMEALLEADRANLRETEAFRAAQEQEMKDIEAQIARSKQKLQQSRSGKEHMAAQREIESNRRAISDREEEILKLIDAVETTKKRIAAHEEDLAELRKHIAAEEEAIRGRITELEARVAGERVGRDEIAKKIKDNVLRRYNSIQMRRGLAVVPVTDGACQGCHMTIPPQLFNTLQRGDSIETCPSCHRIIYWDELMKNEKLDKGEQD